MAAAAPRGTYLRGIERRVRADAYKHRAAILQLPHECGRVHSADCSGHIHKIFRIVRPAIFGRFMT